MNRIIESLSFRDKLDKEMLNMIIQYGFVITVLLVIISIPLGNLVYFYYNFITCILFGISYFLNQQGYFKTAFWFCTVTLSLFMVAYTVKFGFINSHMYLLSGMMALGYFIRKKKFSSEIIWVLAGSLFVLSHYLLIQSGKIVLKTELENLMFYPNLVFSIILLFLSTTLFRMKHERQRSKLRESLELKDRLLSLLSHDLRTPFQNLSGIVELLEDGRLSQEEVDLSFKEIKKNINESYEMLDNVLIWIMSQKESITMRIDSINLNSLVEENIILHQSLAEAKGVKITSNICQGNVNSDREVLSSILRNLISNAIKFSPKKIGAIEITCIEKADYFELEIMDNGTGIPTEKVDLIFSGESSKRGTDNETGFGVGLQLVKVFSDKIKVQISVQTKLGFGAKFHLKIPKSLSE